MAVYPNKIWSLSGLEEWYSKLCLNLDNENKVEVDNCENQLKNVKIDLSKARAEIGMVINNSCLF